MREVDRRSKIDRRNFLKTAAAVPPAAAVCRDHRRVDQRRLGRHRQGPEA
jgi:hypothetical protein